MGLVAEMPLSRTMAGVSSLLRAKAPQIKLAMHVL
jgi:hypothetical protein